MRCGPGRRPIPWLGVPSWVACPLPADAAGQGHRINVLLRYLKLTRERFPRLSLVRRVLPDGARYLGPFPSAGQAELVKAAIEDALPLRRCTMRLGAGGGGSACALLELGRCLGPCTGAVAEERYAALVATLEAALDGDPEPVLGPLRRRMAGYAADQRYEQAAGARDRLEALTRALAEARRAAALLPAADHPAAADPAPDGDPGLRRLLAGASAPEVFEGPPPRHLADEVNLVTRWLEGAAGKVELLWVRGRLASPAVGGARLQISYDPGRHRHAWPPGEARGRPEARPSRRPARRHASSVRWP